MYLTWKLTELKEELKKRRASVKGKKAELVERLEFYDRNFNVNEPSSEEHVDEIMILPTDNYYKDVNGSTQLPPLNKHEIQLYFEQYTNALLKGKKLYENRYLFTLRAATVGDFTYIKGICKAAMKHKIQYEVNIKLHKSGAPEESHCECAARAGVNAHCKHVAVVLYATSHIFTEKCILLEEVSTQKLQTFHHPRKRYYSTPLKAQKLPSKRKKENIEFHPHDISTISKSEYNSRIRSLVLNFPNTNMPLKQLYAPANPFGVEWDHGYSAETQKNKLLKKLYLKDVDLDTITKIEQETKTQSNSIMWHNYSSDRITASHFHTVCHLRQESMPSFSRNLFKRKEIQTRAINHGKINEKVALKKYMETYDLNVKDCGLFISKDRPYLGASPDGLLGEETIVEVKCPYTARNLLITPVSVPYIFLEGDQYILKRTCPYYYQVQGQMYCTNRKFCNFIIYTYRDLKVIFVERNDNFIKDMLTKLDLFYKNYFEVELFNKYIYKYYEDKIKH